MTTKCIIISNLSQVYQCFLRHKGVAQLAKTVQNQGDNSHTHSNIPEKSIHTHVPLFNQMANIHVPLVTENNTNCDNS